MSTDAAVNIVGNDSLLILALQEKICALRPNRSSLLNESVVSVDTFRFVDLDLKQDLIFSLTSNYFWRHHGWTIGCIGCNCPLHAWAPTSTESICCFSATALLQIPSTEQLYTPAWAPFPTFQSNCFSNHFGNFSVSNNFFLRNSTSTRASFSTARDFMHLLGRQCQHMMQLANDSLLILPLRPNASGNNQ